MKFNDRRDILGPAGTEAESFQGGSAEPRPSRGAARADALAALCEGALAGGGAVRSAPGRQQVVVHVEAAGLAGDEEGGGADECRLEDGPAICPETARRLACEGSLHSILHRPDGSLSAGRRTRAVPAAMLRTRNRAAGAGPRPDSLLPLGRGEPFDEELAVAGLLARAGPV